MPVIPPGDTPIGPPPPMFGAPEGPCNSWTIDTTCCEEFWATVPPAVQTAAFQYASLTLWAATGRRYNGCEITVRPCGRDRDDTGLGGWYWGAGFFLPYIIDGIWRNCPCTGVCTCDPRCQVYLPGPVNEIVQVTLDGVIVDPSTYYVDDERWLVRTGGLCWPDCQDYNVSTGVGTFFVTYIRGDMPPPSLLVAAGTLACEWAKGCMGQDCLLPTYIVALSRQGVDFTAVNPATLLENGFTGIFWIDSLIRNLNPYAHTHRPMLLSPDMPGPRTPQ